MIRSMSPRSDEHHAASQFGSALQNLIGPCLASGRCTREFTRENVRQLTVHHKDHNHDNNPSDGSNWELLCLYCHDNEHSRELEADAARATGLGNNQKQAANHATAQPFANLKALLNKGKSQ